MASNNKQVRIHPNTLATLTTIANIRGHQETIGKIIDLATQVLLEKVKDKLENDIKINTDVILEYYKNKEDNID